MNQRIRQLVEKAPYTTVSTEGRLFSQQDLARFAELIVKECADIIEDYGLSLVSSDENYLGETLNLSIQVQEAGNKIKQHFGLNRYTQEDLDEAHKRGVELAKKLRVE